MKKKINFSRLTVFSILIIMICSILLTSCGSKYGKKNAYLEYSASNSSGCGGNTQILSKADWMKNYIEEGVETYPVMVNETLLWIRSPNWIDSLLN